MPFSGRRYRRLPTAPRRTRPILSLTRRRFSPADHGGWAQASWTAPLAQNVLTADIEDAVDGSPAFSAEARRGSVVDVHARNVVVTLTHRVPPGRRPDRTCRSLVSAWPRSDIGDRAART